MKQTQLLLQGKQKLKWLLRSKINVFARRYVERNGSAAMLATKRLVDVAPEVNFREHVTHASAKHE